MQSFLERLRRIVAGSPRPEATPQGPAAAVPEEATAPEIPQSQPEPPAEEQLRESESVAPTAEVVLRLESERGTPAAFAVGRSGATIGRAPENTIRLEDLSVSRIHARVVYRQGAYWLSDAGSMGGTWVDRERLSAPRRLAVGQVVDIGVCRLTVTFTADAKPDSENRSSS